MSGIQNPIVDIKSESNYQLIKIKGKMIYGNTTSVKDAIALSLTSDIKIYIFDLTELEYIDSTGFGVIINFAKNVNEIDGHIVIVIKEDFLFNLFKIAKLNLVFPIYRSLDEARSALEDKFDSKIKIEEY